VGGVRTRFLEETGSDSGGLFGVVLMRDVRAPRLVSRDGIELDGTPAAPAGTKGGMSRNESKPRRPEAAVIKERREAWEENRGSALALRVASPMLMWSKVRV